MSPRSAFRSNAVVILLLVAFATLGYLHLTRDIEDTGDDLGSSYIACRLIATNDALHHLYAYDPVDFSAISLDEEWQAAADDGEFNGWLHPYVQTPLWAWSLQPLCMHLPFAGFDRLFTAMDLLSFAAIIALVAWFWAPTLRSPLAIALVLLALWFSIPFQYAMFLTQTHVLFLLLTLAALMLAERSRPIAAGALLALAAAVKLTPAIFLIYWLVTRRWRAAASFIVVSLSLLLAAPLATGMPLLHDYLATLHRLAHTLLVSQNNQSLAAFVMGRRLPQLEIARFHIFPLPFTLSLLGSLLTVTCTVIGGLLDRRSPAGTAPLGALFSLVAATVFTPIAWTHYFIVLLPPLMVLTHLALRSRNLGRACAISTAAILILALNLPPLATDVIEQAISPYSILRSQFFSGILCLVTLAAVALIQRRYPDTRPRFT